MIEWIYNKLIKVFVATCFKVLIFIVLLYVISWSFLMLYMDTFILTLIPLRYLLPWFFIDDDDAYARGFLLLMIWSYFSISATKIYCKNIINFYKGEKDLGFLFYFTLFSILNAFFKFCFLKLGDIHNSTLTLAIALISTILIYFYINYTIKKRKSY
ncbi:MULTISPECIES: hypothetical protein [unclassified Campylobacter]|uniref:hypothetical protein n=1 Tax=unclassified Campylobacter TaxID=2593542 RepID=UPI001D689497|nr:hypothetical protein [Campylobacter sp. RM9331]MBZ8005608.1 hypothetical protein [Campylobacter sp. RM9332]